MSDSVDPFCAPDVGAPVEPVEPVDFDLASPTLPSGRLAIEASAGTGKTYSLSGLVVRHVAERGVTASQLLVVTFTRTAAAELRDRTRKALVAARHTFERGAAPDDQPWMHVLLDGGDDEVTVRAARVEAAIASFDDATITTIHGFCQQALRQLGQRSGVSLDAELRENSGDLIDEVCRDLLVMELKDAPDALAWKGAVGSPGSVFEAFKKAVSTALGNPGSVTLPADGQVKDNVADLLGRWTDLVSTACETVRARRAERLELGYDDLITRMADALAPDSPERDAVVEALNDRYRLVLVDEFQDTDPVQWSIFDAAFADRLVTVGDPKQAIYRFRGADVHAYLTATKGVASSRLSTNFRSDADLVVATNALLEGFTLGHPDIVVRPVSAREGAVANRLPSGAPLQIRQFPNPDDMQTSKGLSVPLARRNIVADLVQQVVQLLGEEFAADPDSGRGARRVQPGDIAILVPSHSAATEIAFALARASIPAVRTRTGSVLDAPAAAEWHLLLSALERPSHAPTVRAAGLGLFLHTPPTALDPQGDGGSAALGELQRRCARWAAEMGDRTFLGWYDHVRSDSGLLAAVLGRDDGERWLTDLDHIAELLATELLGRGHTPSAAVRALHRMRQELETAGDAGPQMRRIDSDAEAVQISTIHSSKGLQYPIVLLPLSFASGRNDGPLIFQHPEQPDTRVIDIGWKYKWASTVWALHPDARAEYAADEARNDSLRLLYVALTRAQHRTVLWWAPTAEAEQMAINAVLFGRDDEGNAVNVIRTGNSGPKGGWNKGPARVPSPLVEADARERLELLTERSEGLISVHAVAPRPVPTRWVRPPDTDAPPLLAIAEAGDRVLVDRGWRRWSFSSLTTSNKYDAPPVGGGHDEGESIIDTDGTTPAPGPVVPLADVMAGAQFGTLVHAVLERVDPVRPDLPDVLAAEVAAQLQRDRLEVAPDVLTEGLLAAIATPLGPIADGKALAHIPASDRLVELRFDMPIASPPKDEQRVTVRRVGEVMLATLDADDPQREYAQLLADGQHQREIAGYLQGSIDAVLRVPDATCGHRFIVVDYKTNRLHRKGAADPLAAYHPSLLPAAMAEHDYPLQSILYSVALHRYLTARLVGYTPEQHLGGIAYLFVRGMVGVDTPEVDGERHGVFTWRPPVATVLALDHLFTTGGAA